jgi:hypothetical protein
VAAAELEVEARAEAEGELLPGQGFVEPDHGPVHGRTQQPR